MPQGSPGASISPFLAWTGGAWCTSAPGTCVRGRCADAPDHRPPPSRTTVPLPSGRHRAYLAATPTRDRTRRSLGRRSRNWKRTFDPRKVRDDRSRFQLTSRVTGHRPTGLVDRRGGSAYLAFIRVAIALRYRRAISRLRDRAGRQAVLPRRSPAGWDRRATPRRSRSAWMTRAAPTRSGS